MSAIADVMTATVVTALASQPVAEAAARMRDRRVGSVVVVDQAHSGRPTGILTERDLLRLAAAGVDPSADKVGEWMTRRSRGRWPRHRGRRRARPAAPPRVPPPPGGRPAANSSGSCRCATSCAWPRSLPSPGAPDRGAEGPRRVSSSPRPPSATCGASRASTTTASTRPSTSPRRRSLEDVWALDLRRRAARRGPGRPAFAADVAPPRRAPARRSRAALPAIARRWAHRSSRSTCCAPPSRPVGVGPRASGRPSTSTPRRSGTTPCRCAPSCP